MKVTMKKYIYLLFSLFLFFVFFNNKIVVVNACDPNGCCCTNCGYDPDPPDPEPEPCFPSCWCPSEGDRGYGTYPVDCGSDGCGGSCGSGSAACSPPTCPTGFQKATTRDEANNRCNSPSDKGELGGNYECEIVAAIPSPNTGGCHTNGEFCYRMKNCSEIYRDGTANFREAYNPSRFNQFFIPDSDTNKKADGATGYRCGRYEETANSWWQTANANLYAANEIKNSPINVSLENEVKNYCNNDGKCSAYYIRSDSNNCGNDRNNQAGLQMTNSDTASSLTSATYRTQRPNSNVGAYPAFDSRPRTETANDFAYFSKLVNYDGLPNCNNSLPNSGDQTCKQVGNFIVSGNLRASGKQVVFVQGNLEIQANAKIEVPDGNFLAFIVQNNINISDEVGSEISASNTCASPSNAHIQGLYVADRININAKPANDIFNRDSACDKKLIMAGTFVSWQNDILLNRNFKGCSGEPGSTNYHNYNKDNPGVTVLYRPDLLINMPAWMKQPKTMRLETI